MGVDEQIKFELQVVRVGVVVFVALVALAAVFFELFRALQDLYVRDPNMGAGIWMAAFFWAVSTYVVWVYFFTRFNRLGPQVPATRYNPHGRTLSNPGGYLAASVYAVVSAVALTMLMYALYG